jgi:hypothetical protein
MKNDVMKDVIDQWKWVFRETRLEIVRVTGQWIEKVNVGREDRKAEETSRCNVWH